MKKLLAAIILMFTINIAHAVSYNDQKLLNYAMQSSILLMYCGYPAAGWEMVDVSKTLGSRYGYSAPQLAQMHNKLLARVATRIQMQGRVREVDCDAAVNFHASVMRATYPPPQ